MSKILKKIYNAVISLVCTLLTLVAGINPATIFVSAEKVRLAYEQTNVIDDLQDAYINGKAFSLSDYSFDTNKSTQVLTLMEYGYSFQPSLSQNYGLYIYVYNPQGLSFAVNSPLNQVQMSYDADIGEHYKKYPLVYLNRSTAKNYEGLFYKFKIELTLAESQALLRSIDTVARVYRISGIELAEEGAINATEYAVSTNYSFSGYMSGYSADVSAENTLVCRSEKTESLQLQVHPTTYRPSGTNGKNDYTQDSLHSVYFSVPNSIIAEYGKMTAIHASWRDAVLKPALATGNMDAYNAIMPYLGVNVGKGTDELKYAYLGAYSENLSGTTGLMQSITKSGYEYNRDFNPTYQLYGGSIDTLYMMFAAGNAIDSADSYTVKSEEIISQMLTSYEKYGGELIQGKYSSYLFERVAESITEVNIKADEQYSLTSEKISYKWWDLLFHTNGTVSTSTFDGISAIYPVTESDLQGTAEEVANRLYISPSDYAEFKAYYEENKLDSTVYLFRYQVSDYTAQEATLFKQGSFLGIKTWEKVDTNAYFFQEKVNLDFDIIDVTYTDDGVDTVIPVVSNPIDVVPDATPPVYTETDKKPDRWAWLKRLIRICLIALLAIAVAMIVGQVVSWIKKLCNWRRKGR